MIHTTKHHTSDLYVRDHSLLSDSTSSGSSCDDESAEYDATLHSVTFKCIGATKERIYQATLEKLAELLDSGCSVATKIVPEPSNKIDSKALSFQCFHKDKWIVIGYVVHELLDEVHQAITKHLVTNVELVTVKNMFHILLHPVGMQEFV